MNYVTIILDKNKNIVAVFKNTTIDEAMKNYDDTKFYGQVHIIKEPPK